MILDKLAASAYIRVERCKIQKSLEQVKEEALALDSSTGFPFEKALSAPGMSFICEVKKASPSKGMIAEDFPYLQIALDYEKAGAAAISVLTEPEYFLGSDAYLKDIAKAVSIPVLRKDFTVDAYQIYEAKVLGASAVLLICAILSDEQLEEYQQIAWHLGLSVLVEAHDQEEVARAAKAGARIIGVNNRNLKDFTVDIQNSVRLRNQIPEGVIYVSESGIKGAPEVGTLYRNRTDAVLIGETLMRSPDKVLGLQKLRSECHD